MPEPVQLAAWEILQARKGRTGSVARCRSCRRPEGLTVLAWQDGWYAVLIPESGGNRFALFDPWGRVVLRRLAAEERLEAGGWRPVEVQLDAEGACPRCAYCARHNLPLGARPRTATPKTTDRRHR